MSCRVQRILMLLAMSCCLAGCSGEEPTESAGGPRDVEELFAHLSPEDRALAKAQAVCPVSGEPLGSMGNVLKVTLEDERVVFICCEGCESLLRESPDEYLTELSLTPPEEEDAQE